MPGTHTSTIFLSVPRIYCHKIHPLCLSLYILSRDIYLSPLHHPQHITCTEFRYILFLHPPIMSISDSQNHSKHKTLPNDTEILWVFYDIFVMKSYESPPLHFPFTKELYRCFLYLSSDQFTVPCSRLTQTVAD